MKTCDRLDYCPHIQPITFPSQKNLPFCLNRVSVSKFCTSGTCITPSENLHLTIRGPALHHLRTCITPSEDLQHTIRGPASDHPRTCIRPSKDLQHIIQMDLHVTHVTLLGVMQVRMVWCRSGCAHENCYYNLSGQIRIKDGTKWTQSAKSVK